LNGVKTGMRSLRSEQLLLMLNAKRLNGSGQEFAVRVATKHRDAQTEEMLWPQIMNEALVRSAVALVRRQHHRQHRFHSLDPRNLALPPAKSSSTDGSTSKGDIGSKEADGADSVAVAPLWEFEQLEESTAAHLSSNQGFSRVDDFLGADWPELVLADALRLTTRSGGGAGATSPGAGVPASEATSTSSSSA